MSQEPFFPALPLQPSWWSRNWHWFLPTMVLVPIGLCGVAGAGFVFVGGNTLRSTEAYRVAMQAIQADPKIQAILGQPITESGWLILGEVNETNGQGGAGLFLHLKGPTGKVTVDARLGCQGGKWHVSSMTVKTPAGEKFRTGGDVAADGNAPAEANPAAEPER